MPASPQPKDAADWKTVRQAEARAVVRRRRAAGLTLPDDSDEAWAQVDRTSAGLALSGGGIRSASFNLGLLQSLYRRGVLRYIDYLSTASGGGYVGSYLSSVAVDHELNQIFSRPTTEPERPDAGRGGTVFTRDADGKYPSRLLKFIRGGNYLAKPMQFSNRWLIGVFLVNLVCLSGLLTLAAVAALLFRCLDLPSPMRWIGALGFEGDIPRALFPAFLLFVCWVIAWIVSYWRAGARATGGVARVIAILLIVSLLIAIAGLLGTGDIDIRSLAISWGVPEDEEHLKRFVHAVETVLWVVLVGFVALGLLPYIRPRQLIRSGAKTSRPVERFVFWCATRTLLVGMPLVLFAYIARENISGYNERRDVLVSKDVRERRTFWDTVQREAVNQQEPGKRIWEAVGNLAKAELQLSTPPTDGQIEQFVMQPDADEAEARALDRDLPGWERWLLLLNFGHSRKDNQLTTIVDLRRRARDRRDKIFQALTDRVMAGPEFARNLPLSKGVVLLAGPLSDAERKKALGAEEDQGRKASPNPGFSEDGTASGGPAKADPERQRLLRSSLDTAVALELRWAQVDGGSGTPEEQESLARETKINNRNLLKLHYADSMYLMTPSFAATVVEEDQRCRLRILVGTLVVFLLSSLLVDMNDTSLHGFYRNELSAMWIEDVPGFGRTIPLSRLETTAAGAPFHVLSATVNLLGRKRGGLSVEQKHFQFSQAYCGSEATGFQGTEKYMSGRYDLGNAMAISGAAVTPFQVQNPLVSLLLLILNFRLGQWLPNPAIPGVAAEVTPLRLMIDLFRPRDRRHYCFVTDGGHYENLGLEPLLKRRCRLIVVSDATSDPQYEFSELARVLRRMRIEEGIHLCAMNEDAEISVDEVIPRETEAGRLACGHFCAARIRYPHPAAPVDRARDTWGLLLYVKPTFTGDEGLELFRYRRKDNEFPHESTVNQVYSEQQFEAYRKLGEHSGDALCRWLPADLLGREDKFPELVESLANRRPPDLAAQEPAPADEPPPKTEPADADIRKIISQLPDSDTPDHVRQLIGYLDHTLAEVRGVAFKLLRDVDLARAELAAVLLTSLQTCPPAVRRRLVQLLGHLGPLTPDLAAALEGLRTDPDPGVSREVERVLKKRSNVRPTA